MLFEKTQLFGIGPAIRSIRNSRESWHKSDSRFSRQFGDHIGEKDLHLASSLVKAGNDHAKFARMINVYVDITAPLYLYSELDTYKIGTVRNSCSTMYSLGKRLLTVDDFENGLVFADVLERLNHFISLYQASNKKDTNLLLAIKSHLPSSYRLKSTYMFNYQVLRSIYFQRQKHRLPQWKEFCKWIEGLPYSKDLIICK